MTRLSIVIPALGGVERLEHGLVSVLQHRPKDAAVVVVLRGPYADPYDLKDEVTFVQARRRATLAECLNAGMAACESQFVHFLESGSEVAEDWADRALAHFDDPRVAAVVPLTVAVGPAGSASQLENLPEKAALGASHRAGGDCRLAAALHAGDAEVLGAHLAAGFYRRRAVDAVGGLAPHLGPLAVADLSLALKQAGFIAVAEPAARIMVPSDPPRCGAFRQGLYAERLFWRNVPASGWLRALFWHPLVVAQHCLALRPWASLLPHLLGRAVACCQLGDYCRRHHQLRLLRQAEQRHASTDQNGAAARTPLRRDTRHIGPPAKHNTHNVRTAG